MGTLPTAPPKVWRMKDTELDEVHSWLVERLRERWPRLNPEGLWVMLRAAIADKHCILVRTADVVGLFDIMPGYVLENKPILTERFVRQKGRHMHTKDNEQGILLYQHVRDYGRQIGAREFNFGNDTDQPYATIASALQDSRIGSEVEHWHGRRVVYA
jgi:hypothetical protein